MNDHFGEPPDIDGNSLPPADLSELAQRAAAGHGHLAAAAKAVNAAAGDDLRISWKNLALLALGQLSPTTNPDLFEQLHALVAEDNRRAVLWVTKPAGDGEWMYLAKNIQNGKTELTSEILENRADALDMAHWHAAGRGSLVVDQNGLEI